MLTTHFRQASSTPSVFGWALLAVRRLSRQDATARRRIAELEVKLNEAEAAIAAEAHMLVLLTLPVTIVTLGLFIFVINGLLFWFVGSFIQGFVVSGFWAGVFGAIVYSLVSWALSSLVFEEKKY